jgi:hypothetical protein
MATSDERAHVLSRRAVLTGLTAGAGAAGLALTPAKAGGPMAGTIARVAGPISGRPTVATPLQPQLRYVLTCGHDLAPLSSPSDYATLDGQFHFLGTSSGYASVRTNLPVGARITELEMYGTRDVAGLVQLQLWRSTGSVELTASVTVPPVAGPFTVTVAADDLQDIESKSTPFAYIDVSAAPTTSIFGIRIG